MLFRSGGAQVAADRAIRFEHAQVLQREWSANQRGTVLLVPSLVRYSWFQFRSELVNPPALADVRVRRAIVHGMDKQSLNDGIFDGQAIVIDTFLSPDVAYYADLDRALGKYPYDPRRSEQLMTEAGFRRDQSGFFVGASGDRFSPVFWDEEGSQYEKEMSILVDSWRRAGFDMQSFTLRAVQLRDPEFRASFPSMNTTQGGGTTEDRLDKIGRASCRERVYVLV